jgi:hypothetical protein
MFYLGAISTDAWMQFLAGPFDTEGEAIAASGAFEVDYPEYRMRTFVWTCRAGRECFSRNYDSIVGLPMSLPLSGFAAPPLNVTLG